MELTTYTTDINTSISKMEDLLCSANRSVEDKTSCVSCFVSYLRAHAFDLAESIPSDLICAEDSFDRTKKQLSYICSKNMLTKQKYDEGILLCSLQEENQQILSSGENYGLAPKSDEIGATRELLAERLRLGQLWEKALVYDKQIEQEIADLGKPSSIPFEDVETHVSLYGEMLRDLTYNNIDISVLKNSDTVHLLEIVNGTRALFIKIHSDMKRVSEEICQLESVWNEDDRNIYSIIERAKDLSVMQETCNQKGWGVPQLECGEPSALLEKYGLYVQMIELDKDILSSRERIIDPDGSVLELKCKQQQKNIQVCTRFHWSLPRLSVEDLGVIIDSILVERQSRNNLLSQTVNQEQLVNNSLTALRSGSSVAFKRTKSQIDEYEKLLSELKDKKIPMDTLSNVDIEGIRNQVSELEVAHEKKKQLSNMRSALKEQDENLSRIISNLHNVPNINYEELFGLIANFEDTLSLCRNNGINVDKIKNRDVVQLRTFVNESKEKSDRRNKLYNGMLAKDYGLCRMIPEWKQDESRIDDIISLASGQLLNIEECNKNGWELPLLKCADIHSVIYRFNLYKSMKQIDSDLYQIKDKKTYSDAKRIEHLCNQQLSNLKYCAMNSWEVPILQVANLDILLKENRAFCRKRNWRITAIVVGLIILVILIIVVVNSLGDDNSRLSENRNAQYSRKEEQAEESDEWLYFPFSFADVEGRSFNEIEEIIRETGFKNVTCRSAEEGFFQPSAVIDLTIDGKKCEKIECRNDSIIEIVYASENRIEITNELSDWNSQPYDSIAQSLKAKGLDVRLNRVSSNNPNLNSMVQSILINGESYVSGTCYVPSGIIVEISFYENVIKINHSSSYYTDMVYLDVRKELINLGYKNLVFVRDDDLSTGLFNYKDFWYNKLVVSISIDGKSDFQVNDVFSEDADIIIHVHTYKDVDYDYL